MDTLCAVNDVNRTHITVGRKEGSHIAAAVDIGPIALALYCSLLQYHRMAYALPFRRFPS